MSPRTFYDSNDTILGEPLTFSNFGRKFHFLRGVPLSDQIPTLPEQVEDKTWRKAPLKWVPTKLGQLDGSSPPRLVLAWKHSSRVYNVAGPPTNMNLRKANTVIMLKPLVTLVFNSPSMIATTSMVVTMMTVEGR